MSDPLDIYVVEVVLRRGDSEILPHAHMTLETAQAHVNSGCDREQTWTEHPGPPRYWANDRNAPSRYIIHELQLQP